MDETPTQRAIREQYDHARRAIRSVSSKIEQTLREQFERNYTAAGGDLRRLTSTLADTLLHDAIGTPLPGLTDSQMRAWYSPTVSDTDRLEWTVDHDVGVGMIMGAGWRYQREQNPGRTGFRYLRHICTNHGPHTICLTPERATGRVTCPTCDAWIDLPDK